MTNLAMASDRTTRKKYKDEEKQFFFSSFFQTWQWQATGPHAQRDQIQTPLGIGDTAPG